MNTQDQITLIEAIETVNGKTDDLYDLMKIQKQLIDEKHVMIERLRERVFRLENQLQNRKNDW